MENSENKMDQDRLSDVKTVIRIKDFKASKKFYSEILGLKIVEEYNGEKGVQGCILRIGESSSSSFIEISAIDADHYYFDNSYSKDIESDKIDLQIKTNSIDYWENYLKGKWKARGPVDRPWGSRYLYLRDPDGLQIIIYQESQ